jgi:hypothetical protein
MKHRAWARLTVAVVDHLIPSDPYGYPIRSEMLVQTLPESLS